MNSLFLVSHEFSVSFFSNDDIVWINHDLTNRMIDGFTVGAFCFLGPYLWGSCRLL